MIDDTEDNRQLLIAALATIAEEVETLTQEVERLCDDLAALRGGDDGETERPG